MKYLKYVKYTLNNENGAANLEELIGIICAIIASVGVYAVVKSIRTNLRKSKERIPTTV